MFKAMKDSFTAGAARHWLNKRFARLGQIESLRLDSRARRVDLVLRPVGEPDPISLVVERYEIERTDGQVYVRLNTCHCSRPWLQAALEDFVCNKPLEVPPWAAALL